MQDILLRYADVITFYVPLGIIGFWRWSVWIIRRTAGSFYRMPHGRYDATLSVVTPVYNEDPDIFTRALRSWRKNGVDEIVAVIDYTDTRCIALFEEFKRTFPSSQLIITKKPGKRPALVDGTRAAGGEIIAMVDSDTIWSPNIKEKLLAPFADPKVGGAVARQDILKTDTFARRLFKIHLDLRYLFEFPFIAAVSDALPCLSGRTALYRRMAIVDKLDALENETFWGKRMISGDDKTLTHLVHAAGWKTRYLRDVRVYTSGFRSLPKYMKQQLRWARNALRSDSKALLSRWLWRDHKILGLHLIDKAIQPLALLLSPIYFAASLYYGFYEAAAIIAIWWMVSRTAKLYPHLREKPWDIFLVPIYTLMSFYLALVKLYAFATMDTQGWITRWDKNRLPTRNLLHAVSSASAVVAIIVGMTFVVFNYKVDVITAARMEKERALGLQAEQGMEEAARFIFTPDRPRMSTEEIGKVKNDLVRQTQADPYGYYVVKADDTVPILRRRYNLAPQGRILDATTKAPIGLYTPLRIGRQIAIPVEDMRNPLTPAILASTPFADPPRIVYEPDGNTIFVREGGSVATLRKIRDGLAPAKRNLLEETTPGEWILRANLYIGKNVTLVIDGKEVERLKMKSDGDGFVWLRSESGNMLLSDTTVTSWDEKNNAPDYEYENGRSHITARNSGRMDIVRSEFAYLGFVGAPNRGGPFGGSYGVSWKINNGKFRDNLLTGIVIDSKFHGNYFGVYTFGATGMIFRNNDFYENVEYGLDPHDDSNHLLIENNRASHNGNHGIILSRRCVQNIIRNNVSNDNRLHGIMLDRESDDNLVEGNTVYGNVDGIALYASNRNRIVSNTTTKNVRGIRINENSSGNYFEGNDIVGNSRGIYIYDGPKNNFLVGNRVRGNEIGVTLKNTSANELYDNFHPLDNKRDGRVTDDARENTIR